MRSTTFSPNRVGQVLTRKSMDLLLDRLSLMRPSCGTRRSAISSPDITFRREEMRGVSFTGGAATVRNMPSMRRRTRYLLS